MKHLRLKIVLYFLICVFFLQSISSAAESVLETSLSEYFQTGNDGAARWTIIAFLALHVTLFLLTAIIFFRLIKSAVQKESRRQTEEQALMYASLAHDLKTPLTSVVGFSSSLIDKKIPQQKQEDVFCTIHAKALQMNTLLDAMLSYSKLGSSSYSLHKEKTDLCVHVRNIVAGFYNDFESRGMSLVVEIPKHEICANIDRTEFSRAAGNILSNALSHNADGTRVLVKIRQEKKTARLIIADTGTAIDKKEAERLFTPFVSGDTARTSGKNSGLGLAIAHRIAQLHGGRLYMDSTIPDYTKAFVMEVTL